MMEYRVVQCPNNRCGRYTATTARKRFKCLRCRKSFAFLFKNKLGIQIKVLWRGYDGSKAARIVMAYQEAREQIKNGGGLE